MAKIAIDARIMNSSTGTYMQELVRELELVDTVNQYIVIVPSKDATFYTPKNPNFSVVTCDVPLYSLAEQLEFRTFLEKLNVDLVHFCMPQQPLFYKGKRVTTFHDLTLLKTYNSDKNFFMYKFKQFIGLFAFRRIAGISDAIIVPTKYVETELVEKLHADKSKVHLIYEASLAVEIGELEEVDIPFKQFIMYVGKESDYKNIKRLGDAHQELLKKYPDLGLVLVGAKNKATLTNEAYFQSKQYKNIYFTGRIENNKRDWLFTQAQAYVFPSLMEGFGLPALEAMGYGTPVVSSNATCLPEVYGDAAHYFDPTSIDSMVTAIDEVLSNQTLRERLSAAGLEQVKKYSWEKMARETHALYIQVLEQKQ